MGWNRMFTVPSRMTHNCTNVLRRDWFVSTTMGGTIEQMAVLQTHSSLEIQHHEDGYQTGRDQDWKAALTRYTIQFVDRMPAQSDESPFAQNSGHPKKIEAKNVWVLADPAGRAWLLCSPLLPRHPAQARSHPRFHSLTRAIQGLCPQPVFPGWSQ